MEVNLVLANNVMELFSVKCAGNIYFVRREGGEFEFAGGAESDIMGRISVYSGHNTTKWDEMMIDEVREFIGEVE